MRFGKNERLTIGNLLPPAFIIVVIATIWSVYLGLHLLPMLQLDMPTAERDTDVHNQGLMQSVVSQFLVIMLSICYIKAIVTHPGTVPVDAEWLNVEAGGTDLLSATTREVKTTGERRYCKWCQKYKPDRCHHCRFCKTCILRMDHHCPWIMNCVGYRNHKFFFLLVVYSAISCLFITFTMASSVQRAAVEETAQNTRFLLVLGLLLSIIMGFLVSGFLIFHTWLALRGLTTIEFCEKTLSGGPMSKKSASYDQGLVSNIYNVLGPKPLLWFLPMCPPEGDGLSFVAAGSLSAGSSQDFSYSTMERADATPERTGERAALA